MGKNCKDATRPTTMLKKHQYKVLDRLAQKYDIKLALRIRKSIARLLEQQTQNQFIMRADLQRGRKWPNKGS